MIKYYTWFLHKTIKPNQLLLNTLIFDTRPCQYKSIEYNITVYAQIVLLSKFGEKKFESIKHTILQSC